MSITTTIRASIFIARPPEAVTRVILDPELAVLWTTDLERFEVITGNAGEPGAVARLHYLKNGRPSLMQDELHEVDPNRRYRSRVSGEALTAEIETTLAPEEGGTRVAIRWTGSGRRFPFRFLLRLMRRSIVRQAEVDLAKLKSLVEGGAAGDVVSS
jgi:uncharacterized protein YndB with AHSA1/START domain